MSYDNKYEQKRINEAYLKGLAEMVEDEVRAGFTPYLMTFMYRQISGSHRTIGLVMNQEIERVYSLVIQRLITRNPRSPSHRWKLPLFVAVDDWPVPKHDRFDIKWLRPNDGHHKHAIIMMPPVELQRIPRRLDEYLEDEQTRFVRRPVARIHAREITETVRIAIRYIFKSLESGRTTPDDLLVLPRSSDEISSK